MTVVTSSCRWFRLSSVLVKLHAKRGASGRRSITAHQDFERQLRDWLTRRTRHGRRGQVVCCRQRARHGDPKAQNRVRELVIRAYDEHEQHIDEVAS